MFLKRVETKSFTMFKSPTLPVGISSATRLWRESFAAHRKLTCSKLLTAKGKCLREWYAGCWARQLSAFQKYLQKGIRIMYSFPRMDERLVFYAPLGLHIHMHVTKCMPADFVRANVWFLLKYIYIYIIDIFEKFCYRPKNGFGDFVFFLTLEASY